MFKNKRKRSESVSPWVCKSVRMQITLGVLCIILPVRRIVANCWKYGYFSKPHDCSHDLCAHNLFSPAWYIDSCLYWDVKLVPSINSLTAIGGHDRQYFNELRSTVVSRRIFIRSQSLIARWTRNDFSLPAFLRDFYEAFLIDDVSRGSKSYLFCAS